MAEPDTNRGRTRPDESSSDEEEVTDPKADSTKGNGEGRYRARVKKHKKGAQDPVRPLYGLGEVVYVAVSGQQVPSGPYTVVSVTANCQYTLRRQDNLQPYPYFVPESDLRVLS
ncbi:hypothetical protein INS49_005339 [Diaporthe citri]|uniref:uncharacterized protein n=1 Tax=Diaporthe citri TaxID=83186 RepID=UPI001C80BAAF|nr:uncharacterized protein INS49_005339 [Diaporthe citri]KAG6353631.1 hypothetical protein INS49_005339 [Diaporthe citri]